MNEAPILSLRQLLEFGSIKWAYQGDGRKQSQPISYWLTDPGVKPYLDYLAGLHMEADTLSIRIRGPEGEGTLFSEVP
jgi:hypothetical protein